MNAAAEALCAYLSDAPSPYHAVATSASMLEAAGFTERSLTGPWPAGGAWFVRRGGALIAGCSPQRFDPSSGARIVGAHTDSPTLRVKPRPDTGAVGWRQVAVEVYGGILNNSWLDRDLGLSGRVALRDGSDRLLRVDEPLLRVPQLAVHLDREVNDRGLLLDKQQHLTPIWGLGPVAEGDFVAFVAERLGVSARDVVAWDLMVHDLTPPALLGRDRELLASGRLDNLASCWAATEALVAHAASGGGERAAVIALFDHEEVGSASTTGADGPLLEWVLGALVRAHGGSAGDLAALCSASQCVSADMAHSVHPNYPERHEPGHRPLPNGGPVVKVNANQRYATDATSHRDFVAACERAGVPHQVFVSRNSMPCGSTIGPITATRLGIATVDVGCAQLSMHSARELMGAHDPAMFTAALTAWF